MKICIPSHKRADNCKTAQYLPEASVFVSEDQVEEYKKNLTNEIVAIPKEYEQRGMAIIRNFILDHAGDQDILMVDDDISYFGHFERKKMVKMEAWQVYNFAENAFRMTRELGSVLWGVNLNSDKMTYREYSPFSLSSVILGPCMGVIKDDNIRFDERLGLKEDYDYSIQVLNKYRKILRFNKYFYVADHITKKGGCASYRTMDQEREQAERILRKWGNGIISIEKKLPSGATSINPTVHIPIKGI